MSTSPQDFNARIIEEFHANQGRGWRPVRGGHAAVAASRWRQVGQGSRSTRWSTTETGIATWCSPRRPEHPRTRTGTTTSRPTRTSRSRSAPTRSTSSRARRAATSVTACSRPGGTLSPVRRVSEQDGSRHPGDRADADRLSADRLLSRPANSADRLTTRHSAGPRKLLDQLRRPLGAIAGARPTPRARAPARASDGWASARRTASRSARRT